MTQRTWEEPSGWRTRLVRRLLAVCLVLLALNSCSKPVDLQQTLEITDASSGWFDVGIVAGKNKLVPSVTFRLKKKAPVDLERVSINALFRAVDGAESDLDNDVFVQRVVFEGDQTSPITLRPENGYTADPPQTRAEMLKHSQFRDVRAQILVKQSSTQWVELASIPVQRQLLTR